jgi:hypothetical protein
MQSHEAEDASSTIQDYIASLEASGATVVSVEDLPRDHAAPDLEQLLPDQVRLHVESTTATRWRDSKLNRVIKDLGRSPSSVQVVCGMSGGPEVRSVTIYNVPGIAASVLNTAFAPLFRTPKKLVEDRIEVAGRTVNHTETVSLASGVTWISVWWSVDGHVISCSAPDEASLSDLISQLPS